MMLAITTLSVQAQNLFVSNDTIVTGYDSLMFVTSVSHLEEFVTRFNGDAYRADLNENMHNRKNGILLLFDSKQFKSRQDTTFIAAQAFCEKVTEDSIYLSMRQGDWYAEATCQGTFAKKPVRFTIYLKMVSRIPYGYKWVITGADGDVFRTSRHENLQELFISPSNHDLRFMELARITENKYEYIDEYTKDSYRADPLAIFLTLVRTGLLKIGNVSQLKYHYLDVSGYRFTVSHVNRASLNTGWLITELVPCDDFEKLIIKNKTGI